MNDIGLEQNQEQLSISAEANILARSRHPEDFKPGMTRRRFLKNAAIMTAGVAAVAAGAGCAPTEKDTNVPEAGTILQKYKLRELLTEYGLSWQKSDLKLLDEVLSQLPESFSENVGIVLSLPLDASVRDAWANFVPGLDELYLYQRQVLFNQNQERKKSEIHELVHRRLGSFDPKPSPGSNMTAYATDGVTISAGELLVAASNATLENGIYVPHVKSDPWWNFVDKHYKTNRLGEWVAFLSESEYVPDSGRFRRQYGPAMFGFMKLLFEGREYKGGLWINQEK